MTRSRRSARAAGSSFERLVADYLRDHVSEFVDRRVRTGSADKGDVSGLRAPGGGRLVVECKDYGGQLKPAEWVKEATVEAANDGAVAGVVVAKRRGTTDPGAQWVLMTVADLAAILGKTH